MRWAPAQILTASTFHILLDCAAEGAQYNTSAANTWTKLETDDTFSGRNGHAAAVFKEKLWVVGGTGELYQTYNLHYQNRRGDVWSSDDGTTWRQSNNLVGDFHLQNYDALNPGSLAPWYARYGHTLDVVHTPNSTGGVSELMILAGGYTPDPDNDIWVTEDGNDWRFAGNANWTGRGWHESCTFLDKLFIIGGSPLTNDVWAADISQSAVGSWIFTWEAMASGASVPFSPRAGLAAAVVQQPSDADQSGDTTSADTLYVMGGYGGWPEGDSRYNGMRCRNDVYKTTDGDVAAPSSTRTLTGKSPRMWLAGGGYMGQNGNSIVSSMIGYVDMWFSSDGSDWHQVNYEEGSGSNLYSSMAWALTEVDNVPTYLGKWGHRMLAWTSDDGQGGRDPALYIIAGDAVQGGSFLSDVFVSTETLFCTSEGIVCGGVGTCVDFGCTCPDSSGGDFCTVDEKDAESLGRRASVPSMVLTMLVVVLTSALAAVTSAATPSLSSIR